MSKESVVLLSNNLEVSKPTDLSSFLQADVPHSPDLPSKRCLAIHMPPEDFKDRLLRSCIKVLARVGNIPTTANEIMAEVNSSENWAPDSSSPTTKHAGAVHAHQQLLVNNSVSQHIKRCLNSSPKRTPLIGKCTWESENRRKTRYYLTVPGVPVFSEKESIKLSSGGPVPKLVSLLKASKIELIETTESSLLLNKSLENLLVGTRPKSSEISGTSVESVLQESWLAQGEIDKIPSSPPLQSMGSTGFKLPSSIIDGPGAEIPARFRSLDASKRKRTKSEEIRLNTEAVSISDLEHIFGNDELANDMLKPRGKRAVARSLPGTPLATKRVKENTANPASELPKLKLVNLPSLKFDRGDSAEHPKSAMASLGRCASGLDLLVQSDKSSVDRPFLVDADISSYAQEKDDWSLITGKKAQELYSDSLKELDASSKAWCEKQRLPFVDWSNITVISALVPAALALNNQQKQMPVFFGTLDGVAVYFVVLCKAHKKGHAVSPYAKRPKNEPLYSVCLMRRKHTDMINGSILLYAAGMESARERNLVLTLEKERAKCRKRDSGLFGTWLSVGRARKLAAASCLLDHLPSCFLQYDLISRFRNASKALKDSKLALRKSTNLAGATPVDVAKSLTLPRPLCVSAPSTPSTAHNSQVSFTAGVINKLGMHSTIYSVPKGPGEEDKAKSSDNSSKLSNLRPPVTAPIFTIPMPNLSLSSLGNCGSVAGSNTNASGSLPILYPVVGDGKVQGVIANPKMPMSIIGDSKVPNMESVTNVKTTLALGDAKLVKDTIQKPGVYMISPCSKGQVASNNSNNVPTADSFASSTPNYQITLPKGGNHHKHSMHSTQISSNSGQISSNPVSGKGGVHKGKLSEPFRSVPPLTTVSSQFPSPAIATSVTNANTFITNGFPPVIIPPIPLIPNILGKESKNGSSVIGETRNSDPSSVTPSTGATPRNVGNISHLYAAFPLLFNPFANVNNSSVSGASLKDERTDESSTPKEGASHSRNFKANQPPVLFIDPRKSSASGGKMDSSHAVPHPRYMNLPTENMDNSSSLATEVLTSGISPKSLSTVMGAGSLEQPDLSSFSSMNVGGQEGFSFSAEEDDDEEDDDDDEEEGVYDDDEEDEDEEEEEDETNDGKTNGQLINSNLLSHSVSRSIDGDESKTGEISAETAEEDEESEIDVVGL